jgi:protein TonB
MNRLQKKCLIATTGFHLLLILVLVFGSAFFVTHPKQDESQVLDVIPANLVDAAFSSGVKNAQAPAPTPPQPPQQIEQPQPPEPVQPTSPPKPEPVKESPPEPEKPQKLSPDDLKPLEPAEKPTKPAPKKIEVNLKPVVRNTPKATTDTSQAEAASEAARDAKRRANAFARALTSISKNASSATTVEMPGNGSVSYANYASVVKSIYDAAWTQPNDAASDTANVKVSVTIARDGTVVSSRIKDRSGDTELDASVQRALDRVTFVAPFPDGAKENERTFVINFNLKAKRMLG